MSDNIILFSLVQGDSKKRAFKIITKKSDYISDLKKKIKEENPNLFADIDVKDIVLWKVNVPFGDDTMEVNIVLKNNKMTGVQELSSPTRKISNVFTESILDNSIHIVIERPSIFNLKLLLLCITISFHFTHIVQDISAQVLNAFNVRSKIILPEVNELINFFEKPIPNNMKIPLLQREYDTFLIQSIKNTCTSEDLNILFRVSETESAYEFITSILGGLIWNDPPLREGTKYSYVSFWDVHIRFPLETLISDGTSV
ncbi:hypothetical protein Glove_89g99 [Diversispora epigaea]|uniref:Crinkler effector protein N-terminal domain-containing protein n=1 Tax=Diversispora epigaea TaxID=1348612 RepID=A0A397JEL3_9GLOM|nr:hypothetical protein Glove_89g99 [Diversispora epigaea]